MEGACYWVVTSVGNDTEEGFGPAALTMGYRYTDTTQTHAVREGGGQRTAPKVWNDDELWLKKTTTQLFFNKQQQKIYF